MRKAIYIPALIVLALLSQSCNKTYTCTCTVDQPNRQPQIVSTNIDNVSNGDAEYKCNQQKASLESQGKGLTADCHI